MTISKSVKKLYKVVEELRELHPILQFTLGGKLVGDIGEAIVEKNYAVKLYGRWTPDYDAETPGGRKVQIKATMKDRLNFSDKNGVPDYYLGIKIHPDGSFDEIFNGPGKTVKRLIKDWKEQSHYTISITRLSKLNKSVPSSQRIKRRKKNA